ncbi:MAG: SDR family oxidoreductase [Sphingobacteriaceae bacterium]
MKAKSKIVWITGASSGIGEALAYAYSQQGAKLIISSRNKDRLYEVKAACKGNPLNIHVLPLDLDELDALPKKVADALKIFGKIDTVIHSGGLSQRSLAMETDLTVIQRLLTVNYVSTVAINQALLPSMLAQGGGKIVLISSLVGKFGTPFRSAYAASKHALHGYYDSLRAELANKNIQITIVCPGFIRTNVSINALVGDGSAQNSMDDAQAKGMSPELCAQKILEGIAKKREELYVGGKEVYGVRIKRFFPKLFSKLVRTAKVR